MIVLKYDDVIKKSRNLDYYFDIFWKILCSTVLTQKCIARAQLVQDLWRGALSIPSPPPPDTNTHRLFNVI